MKNILTDRQKEILSFIEQFRGENGYPPTLREIGKKFDISSTFGVKRHLEALVKKGYIAVESNASRGISYLRNEIEANFCSCNRELKIFLPKFQSLVELLPELQFLQLRILKEAW